MLLDEIKLIEVTAVNIDFSHKMIAMGQGRLTIDFGELELQAGGKLDGDQSNITILVKAKPEVTGLKEGIEGYDFKLKIELRMLYLAPSHHVIDEKFLIDNNWWFGSQLRTHFKYMADDIFRKSAISNIKLPFN